METNLNIQPSPCIWTCHKCHLRYAMGATQRCIECGHRNCHSERATVHVPYFCVVQFDSCDWERIYNARRSRLLQQQSSPFDEEPMIAADREASRQQESEQLEKMPNGASSCFTDCRSPGECFSTTALSRTAKRANRSSSSSEPESERPMKTLKESARYKRRRRRNFQKTPPPLSQEWHIDDVLDEEADEDAVITGGMEVAKGREEETSEETARTTEG